jgi:hypothetical protein
LAFFTFRPGFAMELSFKAEKISRRDAETAAAGDVQFGIK